MGSNPGRNSWPDLTAPGEYRRLVRLAQRRLVGHEHHAEDVVSRAVIKWSGLPGRQRAVGHLEQVIKSEAYSFLRSEARARDRERRVSLDRSQAMAVSESATERRLFRQTIAETCRREGIPLTRSDVEFIELLLAGLNLTQAQRTLDVSRYEIRKLRDKWRRILRQTMINDVVG